MTTKPQQTVAPFLIETREPRRPVRYRAVLRLPAGEAAEMKSDLARTEKAATADLIDMLQSSGMFSVVEVPVKAKHKTEWVEYDDA